jgi:hypothetical protein
MKYILLTLSLLVISTSLYSQTAFIEGSITDGMTDGPIELANVFIKSKNLVVETNERGYFKIEVPAGERFILGFSRIGYKETAVQVAPLKEGTTKRIDATLVPIESDLEIVVTESRLEDAGMIKENMEQLKLLPTTTGNLESVLPSIALGLSTGTGGELSSQYNVRGGNYDENLVYVNDFEIYRPQLIRAGQQEGLTFANMNLVRDLTFSSGGFDAKYGDKLSSVLDIRYKRPDSLKTSLEGSLLGASAHLEGSLGLKKSGYRKLRYLVGARYKTTQYLLGSLDVKGEYLTDFYDIQAYVTYDINRDWQLAGIGNFNKAIYRFTPEERSTGFGLINFALQLSSDFEGQEIDDFTLGMGGVSLTYLPDRRHNPFFLKFLASTFQINENERFDILGDYRLREVESALGSDNFGNVIRELAEGTQHQYVRNFLYSNVTNVEHKGGWELEMEPKDEEATASHFLQWGVKYQHEYIYDKINEWERLDSAGYSLPFDTNQVLVNEVYKTRNELSSNRFSAYMQDTYTWRKDSVSEIKLSAGMRAFYWTLNNEFQVSPRAQLLYKNLRSGKDVTYKLASGLYYQPPFYRELRNPQGIVNEGVLAQKSAHFVAGVNWDFTAGKKDIPFRFIMEAYYKHLWDLVSYEIDNVRIRYAGVNNATGYVTGLDMRLNGEFVEGAESWVNLSLLRARERLDGVTHMIREVGDTTGTVVNDVPRPTDQLMTLSVFFQDYLPKNKNFKTHVQVTVGTGLPYGLRGNNEVYRNTYRFSPYHRVDIGFSFLLWDKSRIADKPRHPLRFSKSTWMSLEVFNLLKVQNQASTTWVKTIFKQQYAVPNYLTSRRINLRLRMEF